MIHFGSVESSFGSPADTFLPNARFSPKSLEKSASRILKNVIEQFMIFSENEFLPKISSGEMKRIFDNR